MKNSAKSKLVKSQIKKKKKVRIIKKRFDAQKQQVHVQWNFKVGELAKTNDNKIVLIVGFSNRRFHVLSGNNIIYVTGKRMRKL